MFAENLQSLRVYALKMRSLSVTSTKFSVMNLTFFQTALFAVIVRTMKAWKLDRLGGKLGFVDAPIPQVRPDRVLIRVETSL